MTEGILIQLIIIGGVIIVAILAGLNHRAVEEVRNHSLGCLRWILSILAYLFISAIQSIPQFQHTVQMCSFVGDIMVTGPHRLEFETAVFL